MQNSMLTASSSPSSYLSEQPHSGEFVYQAVTVASAVLLLASLWIF